MLAFFFARNRGRRSRKTSVERRFESLRWAANKFLLGGLVIASVHIAAMMAFEDLPLRESIWLTMTTLVTVGYGDVSAKTPLGQASTILLLYLLGIYMAAQAASAWFDYLSERRSAMRTGQWDYSALRDHVVVVSPGKLGEVYLVRMITEFEVQPEMRGRDAVLVTDEYPEGLPGAAATTHVKLVTGQAQDPETLTRAAAKQAAFVVLIADDPENRVSDGITFDVLTRIREMNQAARVIAECVDDRNRTRLLSAGANVVVRPIRAYPEMTITAIVNPGSSHIIENLISASDDHIALVSGQFRGTWKKLVMQSLEAGSGLPIGARLEDGSVVTAPPPERQLSADALYVLRNARA